MSGAVAAQWLERATDDRVVACSNHSECRGIRNWATLLGPFRSLPCRLYEKPLTHFIPSPQPSRATALPGCLPILASQKPAEIGSSPITVFHLPRCVIFLSCSPKLTTTAIIYISKES